MAIPSAALRYAASHHGVVSSDILRRSGLSARQVNRLATGGQLDRLHQGVYGVSGAPRTWEQQVMAACVATRGVASHRGALRLWDAKATLPGPAVWPVEVTVGERRCPRPHGVVVHRSNDLDLTTAPRRQRIPVTTPLRMLVDLGAVVDAEQVARALERCIVSRLLSVAAVRGELDRTAKRGRRGLSVLRSVLADWPLNGTRPDSVLEVAFARLCKRAGLPRPEFQYELTLGGRCRRIDFAFPNLRIAIEVDGFEIRTDRHVFQDERWRLNDLMKAGWRVARFTWHDITHRPDYVASMVRFLLHESAA